MLPLFSLLLPPSAPAHPSLGLQQQQPGSPAHTSLPATLVTAASLERSLLALFLCGEVCWFSGARGPGAHTLGSHSPAVSVLHWGILGASGTRCPALCCTCHSVLLSASTVPGRQCWVGECVKITCVCVCVTFSFGRENNLALRNRPEVFIPTASLEMWDRPRKL